MKKIKRVAYRGADQVSKVSNRLAGCFRYYADPVTALENCCFVERIETWNQPPRDFLGEKFEIIRD